MAAMSFRLPPRSYTNKERFKYMVVLLTINMKPCMVLHGVSGDTPSLRATSYFLVYVIFFLIQTFKVTLFWGGNFFQVI